jgi:hypothetical protein
VKCTCRVHEQPVGWFEGCQECVHKSPGHYEGCTLTPVSDAEHRRKLLAELAGPFMEIARRRLVQLEGFEHPPLKSMPVKDRYQHEDSTTHYAPMTMYYIPKSGVWFLNEARELIYLEKDEET